MGYCKLCFQSSHKNKARTFFRFPKNPEICQLWAEKCNLLEKFGIHGPQFFHKTYRICNEHFESSDMRWNGKKRMLAPGAVPTIKLASQMTKKPFTKSENEIAHEIDDLLLGDDSEFRLKMIDHMCRLCGEEKPSLTQIFGQHGKNLNLPNKIKYIPVKILENDVMPSKVCRTCIKKIEDNFSFFRLCEETDGKIRTIIDMENDDTTYQVL